MPTTNLAVPINSDEDLNAVQMQKSLASAIKCVKYERKRSGSLSMRCERTRTFEKANFQ